MKVIHSLLLLICIAVSPICFAEGNININTADKQTLIEMLSGIGEKKAEAIVTYRESNGPFKSIDDLSNVDGISTKTIDNNREILTVE